MVGTVAVLAWVVGLAFVPAPASAGAEPAVRWTAPAACPDEAAMVESVESYVGRALGPEPIAARGEVTRDNEGFSLELRIVGAQGESETRTFADADCRVLFDAAALMIAVAIDPETALAVVDPPSPSSPEDGSQGDPRSVEPEDVPPQPSEPQPAEPEASEPGPTEPESSEPGLREPAEAPPGAPPPSCKPGPAEKGATARPHCIAVAARGSMQWGPLPRLGFGVGADAALLWSRMRLELGGTFFAARPARLPAQPELGGDIRLAVGHARGCARLGIGAFEFPLCGGVEAGALRGIGVGIDQPRRDRVLWLAALADGGAAWSPVRRFALRTRVGAVVPLVRQRFAVGGLGPIHTPAPVGVRVALTAELRLP